MKNRYEIRLSGSGGQGLMTAGMILGEAASLFDGKFVVQTQSYGAEARGGACKSELIISDREINYPKPTKVDLLLVLSQPAYDKYIGDMKESGVVVVDSSLIRYNKGKGVYPIPITELAGEKVGLKVTANIVSLGIICSLTNVVSYEALERALLYRIPSGTEEINKRALRLGRETEYRDNI